MDLIKFCSHCGNTLTIDVPADDDRPRHICNGCNTIHYQNPKIITGTLPIYQGKILLCKRAIEPRSGLWTLPAGFMENGESVEQGALRETWEEARAKVINHGIFGNFSLPQFNQVYVFYRAELPKPEFSAGPESLEVALFEPDALPWEELAFSVVRRALELHLSEDSNTPLTERPSYSETIQVKF